MPHHTTSFALTHAHTHAHTHTYTHILPIWFSLTILNIPSIFPSHTHPTPQVAVNHIPGTARYRRLNGALAVFLRDLFSVVSPAQISSLVRVYFAALHNPSLLQRR